MEQKILFYSTCTKSKENEYKCLRYYKLEITVVNLKYRPPCIATNNFLEYALFTCKYQYIIYNSCY